MCSLMCIFSSTKLTLRIWIGRRKEERIAAATQKLDNVTTKVWYVPDSHTKGQGSKAYETRGTSST